MTAGPSPLVERRRLRAELRQARQDAGLTQETVAEKMDWSLSKIIRIETGAVGISTNDLTALLRLYRVKDARRVKDLVEIARATRQQAPWSKYRNILAPAFFQYIEYETSASIIRSYETIAIPGLLQTEEYATAVTRNNSQSIPGKAVRMLVEVRMKRQELLNQPKPPLLYFVLDEAVIYRLMGDKGLREAQLAKLINLADRPGVTIEVLPFSAGLHRGMSDTFSLLEFPGSADDVLYLESSLRGSIFTRDSTEEVAVFRELFGDLREMSLGPEGTRDYLIKTADAIR